MKTMNPGTFVPAMRIGDEGTRTIVVAGGAGFVGSHLVRALLESGNRVLAVDNLQTGRRENIEDLAGLPTFRLIEQDILKPLEIDEPVDQIYNLACAASPVRYQAQPIHTLLTCVNGTMNLLELAREKGARILQASTSEVYGDPEVALQHEDYRGSVNPFGPRACYDEGKRAAETLMYEFARMGVETRVARIFNTYGPRMDSADGRVVPNFISQALAGVDLTIYGDGSQTRSFCYVDDLVEGLRRLMASDEQRPVNLGNPGEFTMIELARKVLARTGSESRLCFRPLPEDDPRQRRPDIGRAWRSLGWAPRIALDDGLDLTIAHYAGLAGTDERLRATA